MLKIKDSERDRETFFAFLICPFESPQTMNRRHRHAGEKESK